MQRKVIRTAAVLPVAVASALWTAHLAAPSSSPEVTITTVTDQPVPVLPDGSVVPDQEIELPASVSPSRELGAATDGRFVTVSSRPSAGDIPAVALAAYQRAESLLGSADARCNLSWQLIAAIGRVESDHGRFGTSSLDDEGVARPAIVGPALDGGSGTALIRDTDAGQLDGDVDLDRAVGPMQFIPSTWAVVGVDGDADGTRDPQDIDDAALAAAVYLCSGTEDLSTPQGLSSAVLRYNNSAAYVESVVSIMDQYLAGSEVVIPTGTSVGAGLVVPLVPIAEQDDVRPGAGSSPGPREARMVENRAPAKDSAERAPFGTAQPIPPKPPIVPEEPDPVDPVDPVDPPDELPPVDPEPTEPAPTEEPTEPSDEAVEFCTLEGYVDDPEAIDDDYDLCVVEYDDPTEPSEEPDGDPATQTPAPGVTSRDLDLPLAGSID